MDLIIPIETASRELSYKIFLCNKLSSLGFNCYMGNKYYVNHLIGKMKNYVYIDKGFHKGKSEYLYNTIKANNGIIVSLDEEGAIDYSDNSTLLNVRYPEEMLDKVDIVFLWGNNQYELLKEKIKHKNKLHVTGHPRFQLLKSKYHSLYNDEVQEISKRHGNFILINTNMGFGNNIRGSDFISKNYGDRFPYINEKILFDNKKKENFVSLIKKLSNNLDKKVIIRPHPEENLSYYSQIFDRDENVSVIYEGSVIPWILASEVMIHPDCTTAIESVLLGKRPISLLPYGFDSNRVTKLPVTVSHQFDTSKELLNFIRSTPNVGDSDTIESAIEDYFAFSQDSIELVSNKIKSFRLSKVRNNLGFKDNISLRLKIVKHNINSFLGRNPLSINKLEGFNSSEVYRLDAICKQILDKTEFDNLKTIANQLYLFQSIN